MVTCQSSELSWEVTVELPADFLSLGRGFVRFYSNLIHIHINIIDVKCKYVGLIASSLFVCRILFPSVGIMVI